MVLSIAGSDSGGGAGIQADLKTFTTLGVFATTAITAVTAQSPEGVAAVEAVSPAMVEQQIHQVHHYFKPDVAKTGLLPNAAIVATVSQFLARHPSIRAVVDPVITATSGRVFLDAQTVAVLEAELLPRACLVTPNLDEVAALLGWRPEDQTSMVTAAAALARRYGCAFLVKGGHLQGNHLVDVLYETTGTCSFFTAERLSAVNSHGSGCTLAAGISAGLAEGRRLKSAVDRAHAYLQGALRCPVRLGKHCLIRHTRSHA